MIKRLPETPQTFDLQVAKYLLTKWSLNYSDYGLV
jgi:hypothetical protein